MSADERYINAAFEIIDSKYGGMEQFIKNELNINEKERQVFIEKLTY